MGGVGEDVVWSPSPLPDERLRGRLLRDTNDRDRARQQRAQAAILTEVGKPWEARKGGGRGCQNDKARAQIMTGTEPCNKCDQ